MALNSEMLDNLLKLQQVEEYLRRSLVEAERYRQRSNNPAMEDYCNTLEEQAGSIMGIIIGVRADLIDDFLDDADDDGDDDAISGTTAEPNESPPPNLPSSLRRCATNVLNERNGDKVVVEFKVLMFRAIDKQYRKLYGPPPRDKNGKVSRSYAGARKDAFDEILLKQ